MTETPDPPTEPGIYMRAADTPPDAPWIPLGATAGGSWIEVTQGSDGQVVQTSHNHDTGHTVVERLDPAHFRTGGRSATMTVEGAAARHLAQLMRRYADGTTEEGPQGAWTVHDALGWLKPPPPRRTLARWLSKIEPLGIRKLPQGGPPARTYPPTPIMKEHARWVLRTKPGGPD